MRLALLISDRTSHCEPLQAWRGRSTPASRLLQVASGGQHRQRGSLENILRPAGRDAAETPEPQILPMGGDLLPVGRTCPRVDALCLLVNYDEIVAKRWRHNFICLSRSCFAKLWANALSCALSWTSSARHLFCGFPSIFRCLVSSHITAGTRLAITQDFRGSVLFSLSLVSCCPASQFASLRISNSQRVGARLLNESSQHALTPGGKL